MAKSTENTNLPASGKNRPVSGNQRPFAGFPWFILAVTAIIAAVGTSGWKRWVTASSERDLLLVEIDSLKRELTESRTNQLFDDLRMFYLESKQDDSNEATIAWSQTLQKGVLEISHLPPNRENQSYELWIRDTNVEKLISGGNFTVGENGKLRRSFFPNAPLTHPVGFELKVEGQIIVST